jgi:hypothetical protein
MILQADMHVPQTKNVACRLDITISNLWFVNYHITYIKANDLCDYACDKVIGILIGSLATGPFDRIMTRSFCV